MFALEFYAKASSPAEAVQLLVEHPEAKLISGGTDVLIKLRDFDTRFASLVDIHDLPALKGITLLPNGTIRVGAGSTFSELINAPLIQQHIPILGEASATIAGPQIRNVGTLGGNLCNGAVSADTCAPVLVLQGNLNLLGPDGERTIPAHAFHTGPGRVALKPAELLVSLDFAAQDWKGWGSAYAKYAMREAMDIATVGCAAAIRLKDTRIAEARLAFSVAAPTPILCREAVKTLIGVSIQPDALNKALERTIATVEQEISPRSSWRASEAFRRQIIRTLTQRMLMQAVARASALTEAIC